MKIMKSTTLFFSILLAILLGVSSASASAPNAKSPLADRDAAISRLEARADQLRREIGPGPRQGALKKARIRSEIREISSVVDRLETGEQVKTQKIARLLGEQPEPDRTSTEFIANRAEQRKEIKRRRLVAGPRIGAVERSEIRSDLAKLDRLIAELEAGRDIELARVDELLNVRTPRGPLTPEERMRSLEIELATMKRKIGPGPRIGMVERTRIRDRIEEIDAMIEHLEDRN